MVSGLAAPFANAERDAWRIGVDLGGTKIAGVLLNASGQTYAEHRVATPQGDYAATLTAIVALVEHLISRTSVAGDDIPIGIGTPGVCLPDTGLMTSCNSVCLNDQPLLLDLQRRLGKRVRIANDADCFALAQWHFGKRRHGLLVGVILGTGVGGGLVHQGQLLNGPNHLAGEWGHNPLPYFKSDSHQSKDTFALESRLSPRRCYCGRMNCVETFLSGPGLVGTHNELWAPTSYTAVTTQVLAQAWDSCAGIQANELSQDQSQRLASVSLYLDMLARSLAQVVNILDPGAIVLGGGLSNMDCLYAELPKRMARYLFARETCLTPILRPQGGDASGVFGAAALN